MTLRVSAKRRRRPVTNSRSWKLFPCHARLLDVHEVLECPCHNPLTRYWRRRHHASHGHKGFLEYVIATFDGEAGTLDGEPGESMPRLA